MTIALTSGKSLERCHILFTAQERNARCYKTESSPLRFLLARELKVLPKEFSPHVYIQYFGLLLPTNHQKSSSYIVQHHLIPKIGGEMTIYI